MSSENSEELSLSADTLHLLSRLASGTLLTLAVLSASVLLLGLRRFHPGLGVDQLLTFYVAPAAIFAVLLGALRLAAETRIALVLLLVAAGVTVVGAETALVLIGSSTPTMGREAESPIFAKVLDLRAAGDDAVPSISGNALLEGGLTVSVGSEVVRPLTTGPGRRTIVLCAEFIDPVVYTGDRYGFNNPDTVWDADTVEVVLVGDSYTHGVCVEDEDQVATRLREHRVALNLGVRGVGPLQELAILREYGSLRRPAHVVWVYYEGNDLWDLSVAEAGASWLHEYLKPAYRQELAAYQDEINQGYGRWADSLVAEGPARLRDDVATGPTLGGRLAAVPRFEALRRLTGFGVLVPQKAPPLGAVPEILRLARDEVRAWGGELHVVYLPAFVRFATRVGEGVAGRRDFVAFMEESDIPFLDLVPVFAATGHPRDLWVNPRGHLSPEGYRLVADAILAELGPQE